MKTFLKILFFVSFILTFIFVGDMVVDAIMTLFPVSASDWFPVIRFIVWICTFTFNFLLTIVLYLLCVYVISYLISLVD